ncbi:cell wall-binding repeat-containing protein [Planococcus sp. X10-3]|uniref:cell wall-binding repeat-containing protein n=1 Tax=Planococcus sp. X10-3 TaxID=3061240 RepID=UPI003BAEC6AD
MFQLIAGIVPVVAQGDSTPPVVNNLELSPSNVAIGEEVILKAEVKDDVSGVKSVLVYFDSPSKNRVVLTYLYYNETSGLYEGTLTVDPYAEDGQWTLRSVVVEDNAENSRRYLPDEFPDTLFYQVTNELVDQTPPSVKSIEIPEGEFGAGESLNLKAEVTDDVSGVKSVLVYFDSPSKNRVVLTYLYYNETSGLYEGTLTVDPYAEEGQWTLRSVVVEDNAENSRRYLPDEFPDTLFYQVTNELVDQTPPSVKSIEIPEGEFGAGESLNLKAEVTDDVSGVKSVLVYFDSPSKNRVVLTYLYYNETSGLYEGTLTVDPYAEEGQWTLRSVVVEDNAENNRRYLPGEVTANNKNTSYTVVYKPSDLDSPELNDSQLPYAIVTKNEFLSNRIIDKDLYIGPNSTISIEGDVTITGNVYVYGTLITYGGLTIQGSLNAKSVTRGSNSSVYPGAVRIVGGQNLILSTIISNQPYEVPFAIDNEDLTNENGTIEISGKTLPFLDVSLQGTPISLEADGSFAATAQDVTSDGIQFTLKDVLGYEMKKDIAVRDVKPPANVSGFTVSNEKHNEIQVAWNKGTDNDLKEYALYLDGQLISTLPADATSYKFENLKEASTYELAIAAVDTSTNTSEMVEVTSTTLLSKPIVNPVSDKSTSVTGQASAGTKVSVQKGESVIGSGKTDAAGKFNIEIPAQKAGTELNVFVSNEAGIVSEKVFIIVEDKTAPALPTVNSFSDKDLTVSGTAEAKATITVKAEEKVIAEGTADELGKFSIAIEKQQAGTKLTVTAKDSAGNVSPATEIIVLDETAPESPVVNKVTHKSIEITGSAEANAEVSVLKDSEVIASGKAAADGSYQIAVGAQPVGTKLEVYAIDAAGNRSGNASVVVEKAKPEETTRISGASRYDTAVAISKVGWKTADTVVLATAGNFPDALAGGPLAYQENAPILLTRTATLTKETKAEIARLGAKKVIILGSKGAVSLEVESELKQMGLTIDRIGGKNRYDTAAMIAKRLNSKEAVVAYGLNFPDVLSISAYASRNGIPILLTRTDKLPAETETALESTMKTHVIGSTGAVGAEVFQALPNPVRYGGKDRYATGLEVNSKLKMGNGKAFIATGRNFPDALAGSVLAAKNDAPILLVKGEAIPEATAIQLGNYESYAIFGGTGAVGETVRQLLNKQLNN